MVVVAVAVVVAVVLLSAVAFGVCDACVGVAVVLVSAFFDDAVVLTALSKTFEKFVNWGLDVLIVGSATPQVSLAPRTLTTA